MNEIRFELVQDVDAHSVTIVVWVKHGEEPTGDYTCVLTLSEADFRLQGLKSILCILDVFKIDPTRISNGINGVDFLRFLYARKCRSLSLVPSGDPKEGTVEVLHYDFGTQLNPCSLGEEVVVPLQDPAEAFAAAVFGAFARCQDFTWVPFSLLDAKAFFGIYCDENSGYYYWFDWVTSDIPEDRGYAVTAWGYPRVFGEEEFSRLASRLAVQSLREFPGRRGSQNPCLRPHGSQVRDAGVAELKCVVVYLRDDPDQAFLRSYNFDPVEREQVVGDYEVGIRLEAFEKDFYNEVREAFKRCQIE